MGGILVDIDILNQLIEGYLPDFYKKIQSINFSYLFKNILLKWFVSLFVQNSTEQAST